MRLGVRSAASGAPAAGEIDLRLPLAEGASLPWRFDRPSLRVAVPTETVIAVAESLSAQPGAFIVGGGEPIRRPDASALLSTLARLRPQGLGLWTAGEGLTEQVVERLAKLGVQRMLIPFHCARQDAHDWLVGRPGSLKTAHRAIRACVRAGMPVTAEVVVTRPTMAHLAETVEVLGRTGVGSVTLRRLAAEDANGLEFIPLSPRLELLRESLEEAATVALGRKMRLVLRDLPMCVAPRLRPLFAPFGSELWVSTDGVVAPRSAAGLGCVDCPGEPACGGAPADYVERFGWEEFVDPGAIRARMVEDVAAQQRLQTSEPMVFSWQGPHRVRCEACGDRQAATTAQDTRSIRARMVVASRYRPREVRLVGADLLAHPAAAALVYDALRLFPVVDVAGEASPIVDWSDLDLRRLKGLRRLDVALYGPDAATHDGHCGIPGAFAAALRAAERLANETEVEVGGYALIHEPAMAQRFAEEWERGALPGSPRFRLSPRASAGQGGRPLDELAGIVASLPQGPARAALQAVLPVCGFAGENDSNFRFPYAVKCETQQIIELGRSVSYRACGTDPLGEFERCPEDARKCADSGCPGLAVGWHGATRSEQWTANT